MLQNTQPEKQNEVWFKYLGFRALEMPATLDLFVFGVLHSDNNVVIITLLLTQVFTATECAKWR